MFYRRQISAPIIFFAALLFVLSPSAYAESELVIADFDTGDQPNNIGGGFGAWDKDPGDETQGVEMELVNDDAKGDPAGYSVRLDYDVDSPNTAYNGFWMSLNGIDATSYNTLGLYLRGVEGKPHSPRVKIELKDMSGNTSAYFINGVGKEWKRVRIPFYKFKKLTNWERLKEFVLVFDDLNSDPKAGTILIDHISFRKK